MVCVSIEKKEELIDNITISGHAEYDEKGKDIVCASVSSIVITTINGLLTLDSDSLEYIDEDGYIKIILKKHSDVIECLIQNMINLLTELETDYKKYIKIEEVRWYATFKVKYSIICA